MPCKNFEANERDLNAWIAYGQIRNKALTAYFLLFMVTAGIPHVFEAELFPFPTQQRTLDQPSQLMPQLSKEDIARATRLADQAKKLTPAEEQQFRENILRKPLEDQKLRSDQKGFI
ncbi:MAG: hypothetical protein QM706_14465 [Nitrospira sp.]